MHLRGPCLSPVDISFVVAVVGVRRGEAPGWVLGPILGLEMGGRRKVWILGGRWGLLRRFFTRDILGYA